MTVHAVLYLKLAMARFILTSWLYRPPVIWITSGKVSMISWLYPLEFTWNKIQPDYSNFTLNSLWQGFFWHKCHNHARFSPQCQTSTLPKVITFDSVHQKNNRRAVLFDGRTYELTDIIVAVISARGDMPHYHSSFSSIPANFNFWRTVTLRLNTCHCLPRSSQ